MQCVTVVVELGAVVEDHQPSKRVARVGGSKDQVDGVGQVVDAGRENRGLCLGDDRQQLRDRGAGLQRNRHCADPAQRDVDVGVVNAGEAEHAHPVTGCHCVTGQRSGHCVDPAGQLAVGDCVEPGKQLGRCASGLRVFDQLDSALSQRRPVRVAREHGVDHLGESGPGVLDGRTDRFIGPRGDELRVVGGQLLGATCQAFLGINRHSETSQHVNRKSWGRRAAPNDYYVSKTNGIPGSVRHLSAARRCHPAFSQHSRRTPAGGVPNDREPLTSLARTTLEGGTIMTATIMTALPESRRLSWLIRRHPACSDNAFDSTAGAGCPTAIPKIGHMGLNSRLNTVV